MRPRLPDGFRIRMIGRADQLDDGRVWVGGSPLRALRLSPRARAAIDEARARGTGAAELVVHDDASAAIAARLVDGNFAEPVLTAPAPAPDQLTVVVPVRDRAAQLDALLTGLAAPRVVVVDDASLDPATVAAVATRHGAEIVALRQNRGPAGARNAGLEQVRTPYVAFVDSDVTVRVEELTSLCRHFADPAVALVGPRVRGRTGSEPRWFERYDAWASSLDLGARPAAVRPRAAVAWLPSACLVGRTAVLRDLGGFDAALRVGEDVDLVWRLAGAGWTVRYDPAHEAAHDSRSSVRGWLGRKVVYGSGSAALARRHGSDVAPAEISPGMAMAAAAVLLRRRWSVPVALAGVAWAHLALVRTLPAGPGSRALALRLSGRGMGWALRQQSSLLLRDWWPLTALALGNRSVRRAAASALVVDSAVALTTRRRPPGLAVALVGRRLDDAAYGAGLWSGCARTGSVQALVPALPRSRVRPCGAGPMQARAWTRRLSPSAR